MVKSEMFFTSKGHQSKLDFQVVKSCMDVSWIVLRKAVVVEINNLVYSGKESPLLPSMEVRRLVQSGRKIWINHRHSILLLEDVVMGLKVQRDNALHLHIEFIKWQCVVVLAQVSEEDFERWCDDVWKQYDIKKFKIYCV